MPELGRTQYFFGAVVLILNITLLSVGFFSVIYEVTGTLNGPKLKKKQNQFLVEKKKQLIQQI